MQEKIDKEVSGIIEEAYKNALKLVRENISVMDKVVIELLKKETLDREDFEKIVGKKPIEDLKFKKS